MLFTRKTCILAKIESVYGTDPVPTGGANAMLVRNCTLTPQDLDTVDRDLYRPYFGNSPQLVTGQKVGLDFEIEIAGAGTSAITAPAYDPILQACGFAGASNVTKWDFTPISSGLKSVTIYTYIDGVKHAMTGAMGSVEFDLTAKQIPVMKFKFLGLYVAPADQANPALTTTSWQTPLGVNNTNTTVPSIHGYSCIMQSLSINVNNTLSYQSLPGTGGEYVTITDRKPTGSMVIQAVTIATKDFFAIAKAMTLGAVSLTHGTVAFNKFQVACPNVQLMKPSYGDLEGVRMLSIPLQFVPTSAGNDEMLFSTL